MSSSSLRYKRSEKNTGRTVRRYMGDQKLPDRYDSLPYAKQFGRLYQAKNGDKEENGFLRRNMQTTVLHKWAQVSTN